MNLLNSIKRIIKRRKFLKWAQIGKNLKVGVNSNCSAEREGSIKIGDNCEILGALICMDNGNIEIGDHTEIRGNSFIGSVESIKIGSCVIISNNVKIYDNNNHPTSPSIRKQMCIDGFYGDAWRWAHSAHAPVNIEDNVWIGEGATILKGVTIGKGSIVATRAVVTKDVPPYTIVAGNPAKVVKRIED